MLAYNLDIIDGKIVRVTDGRELMTLGELFHRGIVQPEPQSAFVRGKYLTD